MDSEEAFVPDIMTLEMSSRISISYSDIYSL